MADAIGEYVSDYSKEIETKKVDFLSEWNAGIESAIVKGYLGWIHHAPASYNWMYQKFANHSPNGRQSHKVYDFLFLNKMEQILIDEKPDLLICTHALPSYLISKLKKTGRCSMPCVNAYTNFFAKFLSVRLDNSGIS